MAVGTSVLLGTQKLNRFFKNACCCYGGVAETCKSEYYLTLGHTGWDCMGEENSSLKGVPERVSGLLRHLYTEQAAGVCLAKLKPLPVWGLWYHQNRFSPLRLMANHAFFPLCRSALAWGTAQLSHKTGTWCFPILTQPRYCCTVL